MNAPNRSKHWELVAEEIGIDVPPQPLEEQMPDTQASVAPPLAKKKQVVNRPQKRSATDWGSVAQGLGVVPVPDTDWEPTEAAPVERPTPAKVKPPAAPARKDEGEESAADDADRRRQDEPERPRRRRRTRRRSGRRQPPRGEDAADSGVHGPDKVKATKTHRPDTDRRRNDTTSAAEAETTEAEAVEAAATEDDEDDERQEGDEEQGVRPGQRNIPTWEEAISVVVQENIQNRSARSRPPHSSSTRRPGRDRR